MSLPKFHTDDQPLSLLQSQWAAQLDPVLRNPVSSGLLLKSVKLQSGANQVNHLLGRKLQGWVIVRLRGAAPSIYDNQDTNKTPDLTLSLQCSSAVTVDLLVF